MLVATTRYRRKPNSPRATTNAPSPPPSNPRSHQGDAYGPRAASNVRWTPTAHCPAPKSRKPQGGNATCRPLRNAPPRGKLHLQRAHHHSCGFLPRRPWPLRGCTIVSYRTPSRRAPVAVSPPRPARLGRETCARGTAAAGLRATRPTRGSPRSRRQKHLPAGWYCP